MYDTIIVGARAAGAPTAMMLARAGHHVLLVDRASFPSDTLSTHYIHQPGVARLERWGLLNEVADSNCPPIRQLVFDVGPFALVGVPSPSGQVADAYAPRRTVLDKILVDAAAAAGVEVRERFSVDELVFDGDRVAGIRGRAAGGSSVKEKATLVVGADGTRSFVARSVQAPAYDDRASFTCAYYTYWGGLGLEGAELYPRPERMIVAGPTNDDEALVIVYWPRDRFGEVRAHIEGSFTAALELAPGLAERARAGERSDRFYGTGDLPFFFRKPYGPGWALVGDAGYHKDPITAQGITDAFRDAELLSGAIDEGLGGEQPLEQALTAYEQARNEQVRPLYEFTHELAAPAPPSDEMQALFAALRDNQEQTNRFFGTFAGTVPVGEFFTPENMASIMSGAMAA